MIGDNIEMGEWQRHKVMQCTTHVGVTSIELDAFRRGIWDRSGSHSCQRCWVSQKYCATGEDIANQCQWPNVVVPVAKVVVGQEKGVEMI